MKAVVWQYWFESEYGRNNAELSIMRSVPDYLCAIINHFVKLSLKVFWLEIARLKSSFSGKER